MSRDGHTVAGPYGSIRIAGDALSGLVVTAAELVEGARARRPRRGVDVTVERDRVRVELELAARFGIALPELARTVQERVAGVLGDSTGLTVERVDVSIEELDA